MSQHDKFGQPLGVKPTVSATHFKLIGSDFVRFRVCSKPEGKEFATVEVHGRLSHLDADRISAGLQELFAPRTTYGNTFVAIDSRDSIIDVIRREVEEGNRRLIDALSRAGVI